MGSQKTTKHFTIVPAILEKRWTCTEKQAHNIARFSRLAHIDVADGKFVSNKTFLNLKNFFLLSPRLRLEIHLMVEHPSRYLADILSQSNIYEIIVHIESFSSVVEFLICISKIRKHKKRIGIALNPKTPLKQILPWITFVDEVYFLTVTPGKQGNPFQYVVLKKIKTLSDKMKHGILAVDGGVSDSTIGQCRAAGATKFVVGSFLMHSSDPKKQFSTLYTLLKSP